MNDPAVPSTLQQYGPLGLAVVIFAGVIVYLFKLLQARAEINELRAVEMAKERAAWTVERERLRAEYEEKHRHIAETLAEEIASERDANRAHEDLVRKEFTDLMERLSDDNVKSSDTLVQMLQKFHDRFVGPAARRR